MLHDGKQGFCIEIGLTCAESVDLGFQDTSLDRDLFGFDVEQLKRLVQRISVMRRRQPIGEKDSLALSGCLLQIARLCDLESC